MKHNEMLQSQTSYISNQVQKACSSGYQLTQGYSNSKSPDQYSERHCRTLKHQRTVKCAASLEWLKSEGYRTTEIHLKNDQTSKTETITLETPTIHNIQDSLNETKLDILNMMLYIKDKYNISGSAYHEMAQLCKEMPRHYQLKQRISELNKLWKIFPTPNNTCGVQQSLEERLRCCLEQLVCISLYKNVSLKLLYSDTIDDNQMTMNIVPSISYIMFIVHKIKSQNLIYNFTRVGCN